MYYAQILKYMRNSHCAMSYTLMLTKFCWQHDFNYTNINFIKLHENFKEHHSQLKISHVTVNAKVGVVNIVLVNKYLAMVIFQMKSNSHLMFFYNSLRRYYCAISRKSKAKQREFQ